MMCNSSRTFCFINSTNIILHFHSNKRNSWLHQHFIVYMVRDDNDRSLFKTCCESECARLRHAINEGWWYRSLLLLSWVEAIKVKKDNVFSICWPWYDHFTTKTKSLRTATAAAVLYQGYIIKLKKNRRCQTEIIIENTCHFTPIFKRVMSDANIYIVNIHIYI